MNDEGQKSDDGRPLMTPTERHMYAVKEMERVVHEFELFAESSCSAQELTGVIVQHVLKLTDVKRKVFSLSDHSSCHKPSPLILFLPRISSASLKPSVLSMHILEESYPKIPEIPPSKKNSVQFWPVVLNEM